MLNFGEKIYKKDALWEMWKWRIVFIQSLCYAVLRKPFFPNFYEKIQEICS